MTDRLAEKGAVQYAIENYASADSATNRVGAAGWIHGEYSKYEDWAAANAGVNPSRLSARGRLYGMFYDNVSSWEPAVLLTGSAFSAVQILPGFAGSTDTTTNATRVGLAASSGTTLTGGSLWVGRIKSTAATIVVPNDWSSYPGAIQVSIDGGAFSNASNVGSTFTLYTGLSDVERLVVFRLAAGWGENVAYLNKSGGNIFNLTGSAPYVAMPNGWVYPGVTSALSVAAGATKASIANFDPNRSKYNVYSNLSNNGAARIRGNFQKLYVASAGSSGFVSVYVSKNGAAPTKHTLSNPGVGGTIYEVTGLSGTATYTVWAEHPNDALFSVAGDAAHVDIGTKKQIHQFGDSITYGQGGFGEVDVLRVGAAMGFAGLTLGVSGMTTSQLDTAISTYLTGLTVTSSDVAVLAIGRNDVGSFNSTVQTAYTSIINKLLTKGYGKVICRGILPAGDRSTLFPTENGIISGLVTAVGDAKAVFCDTSACPTYSTTSGDNTHPDASGYATVATHVESLYRTILGI